MRFVNFFSLVLSLLCLLSGECARTIAASASTIDPVQIVTDLIQRQFGPAGLSPEMLVLQTVEPTGDGFDVWQLSWDANSSKPVISGSSAIALAVGLRNYLEDYCHIQLSWTGDQLTFFAGSSSSSSSSSSFESLPQPNNTRVERAYNYTYYQNVCTVSYSFAFWNWTRWEREIDWMALNGVNLPLAFTGQEFLWLNYYESIGLAREDIIEFFGGPAFLAWQRMGNIQGSWPMPLPYSFIESQFELQIQILTRMQEYGMSPVLPGFAGHVPSSFKSVFPSANVTVSPSWANFGASSNHCCVSLLQPSDPLFITVGSGFIQLQAKIYESYGINVSHIYNIDTYNEVDPSSSNPTYLSAASLAVYKSLIAADPEAIWLMQGWLFLSDFWTQEAIKAYLGSIPDDKMIVLDLFAESIPIWKQTDGFYGKKWIWCMLHNFGGQLGMHGAIDVVANGPIEAKANATAGPNLIGVGLTMEGINQNYVVYDLALEMGWLTSPPDLSDFISSYALRRYGIVNSDLLSAWNIMSRTVYNSSNDVAVRSMITYTPSLDLNYYGSFDIFYDPAELVIALSYFINSSDESPSLLETETFQYDLVDITHQVLSNLFVPFQLHFGSFYSNSTVSELINIAEMLEGIIDDMDVLMSSNPHTLLGTWIESARWWGSNSSDSLGDFYEYQARNQITLWGPNGEISDYASKLWGGLISDYYNPRWTMFLDDAISAKSNGVEFNQTQYETNVLVFAQGWNEETNSYSTTAQGNSNQIVTSIFKRYLPLLCSTYSNSTAVGWSQLCA